MIIVGGGAAGMMTAIKAADRYEVTVIEKNEKLGKKLFITGKGRCNITNNSSRDTFLNNVTTNSRFLYSAISEYDQAMLLSDLKDWGLKVKTERASRVFPVSDHSSDVIKTLENEMKKRGVKILLNSECTELLLEDFISDDPKSKYKKKVTGIKYKDSMGIKTLKADIVVVCAGGASYPSTGSDGKALKYLESLGVSINPFKPSLVPFNIKESFCKDLMGLSLKNVTFKVILKAESDKQSCINADTENVSDLSANMQDYPMLSDTKTDKNNKKKKKEKDKILYEEMGEMLFTHFGVSGPLVLSASSYIHKYFDEKKFTANRELLAVIDLKPALDEETLDKRVLKDFAKYENREFANALSDLLPRALIPVVIKMADIDPMKKVNSITHEERKELVRVLKNFTMHINSLREWNEAIVSSGGVMIKEIDPKTMELKKIRNLKVAGEIIDCDALTGGFNLQIAWSTANSAAKK